MLKLCGLAARTTAVVASTSAATFAGAAIEAVAGRSWNTQWNSAPAVRDDAALAGTVRVSGFCPVIVDWAAAGVVVAEGRDPINWRSAGLVADD